MARGGGKVRRARTAQRADGEGGRQAAPRGQPGTPPQLSSTPAHPCSTLTVRHDLHQQQGRPRGGGPRAVVQQVAAQAHHLRWRQQRQQQQGVLSAPACTARCTRPSLASLTSNPQQQLVRRVPGVSQAAGPAPPPTPSLTRPPARRAPPRCGHVGRQAGGGAMQQLRPAEQRMLAAQSRCARSPPASLQQPISTAPELLHPLHAGAQVVGGGAVGGGLLARHADRGELAALVQRHGDPGALEDGLAVGRQHCGARGREATGGRGQQ